MATPLLPQPGILAPLPRASRYLTWQLTPGTAPISLARKLRALSTGDSMVVGLGSSLVLALGSEIPGLHEAKALAGPGVSCPATPAALWIWLRGAEHGELVQTTHALRRELSPELELDSVVDGFLYGEGRDLSGYVDGTENPTGAKALEAALSSGVSPKLDGSSFVAVQKWQHRLNRLHKLSQTERDDTIGRTLADDEELDSAPESAHVKRTAQESFSPEAFILRRSMPWTRGAEEGLVFVAFGGSFDAFEALLTRMLGLEDGTVDALFRFTRPLTSSHYWCPPLTADGLLNLSALGLVLTD